MITGRDCDDRMSGPADSAAEAASPLVSYALNGLRRLWLPMQNGYAHSHPLDVPAGRSLPLPMRNAFYTLNVLLGMSRLPPSLRPPEVDFISVYLDCCG